MIWLSCLLACGAPEPTAPSPSPPDAAAPAEPLSLEARVEAAMHRAAPFLADWPGELRFDAAIGLHEIREVASHPDLDRAWERARAVADHDADHLHRRFWADIEVPPTNTWVLPSEGRPKVNDVVAEALWCDRYPIREQTLAYLAGDMRDDGGYWSTHAAWSLALAHERGCLDDARFDELAAPIRADLLAHQPATLTDPSEADVDLFAERLSGLVWLGHAGPEIEESVEVLLAHQREDGGWGEPSEDVNPYFGYHAALVSSWALAEYRRAHSSGSSSTP
ncbi:MAG: hypothetical protein EP330_19630 [Deltaproteobacteria bacterium]|nr:MAG: hypothetical protein EP330_19630 [Deltaproteobacteria bacterium]